jgi:cbb3-type cytochrome oxidase subunit 1
MVSNAITQGVKYVLSYIGLNLPDYAITLGTIIFIILLLWKFGNAINKIILIALIFLLLSSLAGLAAPLLGG